MLSPQIWDSHVSRSSGTGESNLARPGNTSLGANFCQEKIVIVVCVTSPRHTLRLGPGDPLARGPMMIVRLENSTCWSVRILGGREVEVEAKS